MENLRLSAMAMELSQLERLLMNEEYGQYELEIKILEMEQTILLLNFNRSIKQTTIEALQDIAVIKKHHRDLHDKDFFEDEFDPFAEEGIKKQEDKKWTY